LEINLVEEEGEALEIKYPTAVKEKDRLNVILIGPEKSGKTTVVKYLAEEH
jgi:polynucleotide 5'-kinase involved in rRNA processing